MTLDQPQSLSCDSRRRLILAVLIALIAVFIVIWSVEKRSHRGFSVLYEVKVWVSGGCSYFPVAFSSDDAFFMATDFDDRIVLIDLLTGRSQTPFPDGTDSGADSIAFATNGSVVAAGAEGVVRIWEIETNELIREFSLTEQLPVYKSVSTEISTITYPCNGVVISQDGRRVVCCNADENLIQIWNVNNGALEVSLPDLKSLDPLAFSNNGNLLALRDSDIDELSVWDVSGAPARRLFAMHTGYLAQAAFSPNEDILATADDGKYKLWDARSGLLLRTLTPKESIPADADVGAVAFSLDGSVLAVGVSWTEHPLLTFDPWDWIIGADRGIVTLWDVTSGAELEHVYVYSDAKILALSNDGRKLAVGSWDGRLTIWETPKLTRPAVIIHQ